MKNKVLKKKVETLTLKYIDLFKDEYTAVCHYLETEREKNKDKYASVSNDKVLRRKIFEIPETLNKIFIKELSVEELKLTKEGDNGKDFAHWFAKRFPEFAAGKTV